jgi:hypothetical protein
VVRSLFPSQEFRPQADANHADAMSAERFRYCCARHGPERQQGSWSVVIVDSHQECSKISDNGSSGRDRAELSE